MVLAALIAAIIFAVLEKMILHKLMDKVPHLEMLEE